MEVNRVFFDKTIERILLVKYALCTIALIGLTGLLSSDRVQADAPEPSDANFNQDREAILAMAGEFRVSFQFDETLTLDPDSESSKRHRSRGFETEDRGDFIQLQHLLVVVDDEGDRHVVKHWRQDWAYEPDSIVVYRGDNVWQRESVAPDKRRGAWSQTVHQVDDSPRYSGLARWRHVGGHSSWESAETWRPLPRRERTKRDDYDVLVGTNRHSLTPEGWAHEQDNYKLALRDGERRILAREFGLNRYTRISDFDFSVAGAYWTATEPFWAAVREYWDDRMRGVDAVHIAETLDGEKRYNKVLAVLKEYRDGGVSLDTCVAKVKELLNRSVDPVSTS